MAKIIRLMKSKFFWRKIICFWKVSTYKMELHTCKMVASLEYSKIQNLICNNSITHRIMTDTYNSVRMKYNNKHKSRLRTIGLRSIIFKIHLTVQLFSMYCLLYREMSFIIGNVGKYELFQKIWH